MRQEEASCFPNCFWAWRFPNHLLSFISNIAGMIFWLGNPAVYESCHPATIAFIAIASPFACLAFATELVFCPMFPYAYGTIYAHRQDFCFTGIFIVTGSALCWNMAGLVLLLANSQCQVGFLNPFVISILSTNLFLLGFTGLSYYVVSRRRSLMLNAPNVAIIIPQLPPITKLG